MLSYRQDNQLQLYQSNNCPMENYQAYIAQFKQLCVTLYRNQYFEEFTIVFTVILFFLLGRISHEKRLTHLLQLVNDAETTRKKLTTKLEKDNKLFQSLSSKKRIIWVLFAILIVANAALYYFSRKLNLQTIFYTGGPFLIIALIYFIALKVSNWRRNKTEKRLKSISVTTETEIKQILKIFGDGLKNRLKMLYESDIDAQWAKQSKQQCKLYKCYNQKKCFQDLFKLYEEVIDQIKKINMCDVCLSEENISVQKLAIADLQTQIKNIKRARTGKLNLAQKKQIVNRLLAEYQKMNEKLPHICKKGCCIKQRALIENAKIKFHDRLKRTQSQLASAQKK